jgi:hypothetical protein
VNPNREVECPEQDKTLELLCSFFEVFSFLKASILIALISYELTHAMLLFFTSVMSRNLTPLTIADWNIKIYNTNGHQDNRTDVSELGH